MALSPGGELGKGWGTASGSDRGCRTWMPDPALVRDEYELPQNREVFGIETSF